MNKFELARYIDHTLLKPDAKEGDIIKLCKEALEYKFASVCVNASYVKLAYSFLQGTEVRVCTVAGFPLGATTKEAKAFEASQAIENGAAEIDMVINIGALKSGKLDAVKEDIREVAGVCKDKALLKVIIETCLLTDEEKVTACLLSMEAGADFVKTSTGFSVGGATAEDIKLMRRTIGPDMGVKASGGIRNLESALKMIEAGASRIGASASVSIVNEL
ncbi:MAG TPA: deoxyribose-phosphate aldolase [Bacillota bacterium]|nr:deoxyribose-phosphate aldolase [Bacillota bacterium]HNU79451.1 deoxyribose-phosphate aldolase [Bacillota bacterium]HPW41579.1 deoxyribose-phosphate aldolase [Bacillota bacterium]HPX68903.1 deoxyribose-phosphate aldolase [Bacillota bacterium]HQA65191.1 deoxyribose-phosphate aldolase [Bacillota bacterium]